MATTHHEQLDVHCTACGHSFEVSTTFEGTKVKCPRCTEPLPIPRVHRLHTITCPNCATTFKIRADSVGKVFKCKECDQPIPSGMRPRKTDHRSSPSISDDSATTTVGKGTSEHGVLLGIGYFIVVVVCGVPLSQRFGMLGGFLGAQVAVLVLCIVGSIAKGIFWDAPKALIEQDARSRADAERVANLITCEQPTRDEVAALFAALRNQNESQAQWAAETRIREVGRTCIAVVEELERQIQHESTKSVLFRDMFLLRRMRKLLSEIQSAGEG